MIRVAFQGTFGAYGHEALQRYFKEQAQPVGYDLSEEVFEALLAEEVAVAILPVENSIVGNVAINSDLIYQNPVRIIAEFYLPIRHSLLAMKGSTLEQIKEVHSHPIALAQCRKFLDRHKIKAVSAYDTAGSSARLNEWNNPSIASISSDLCAELYDLDVLSRDIQQVENNFTRFVVVTKEKNVLSSLKAEKTSLAFTTKHTPGALLECLKIFADYELNLTKLESRPIPENPFQYIFFVDFIGDILDPKVAEGIEKLNKEAQSIKLLGSYPKAAALF